MQHLNYVNKHVNNAVSPRGRALLVHVTCLRRAEAGHDQRALGLALATVDSVDSLSMWWIWTSLKHSAAQIALVYYPS